MVLGEAFSAVLPSRVNFTSEPSVLAACGEKDEFSFLRSLLPFCQKARQEEKLEETKRRLLSLLPGMGMNPYFEETAKKEIESF